MKRYQKANEGVHAPGEIKEKAARPAGKRPYARWAGAVAAVLAVAVIGGIALRPGQAGGPGGPAVMSNEGPENGPVLRAAGQPDTSSAYALSTADYPEMHPYPKDEDYFVGVEDSDDAWQKAGDAYSEAWGAWWKDRDALRSLTDYTGMLDRFLTASAAQFLTGAGAENRVYSPLNVYMALSMLAEAAGGNTRQQILDLLQADSIETLRTRAFTLWRDNYQDDGIVTSLLANSLWLRDGMTYSQQTLDTLAEDYYASTFSGEMGSEAYNQALRDWINQQTRGLLAEQAGGLEMAPETVLALASTIYFKAAWHDEFNGNLTDRAIFHAPSGGVEADFMHQAISSGTYYWGEHFSAVSLSFRESGAMWFILPDEGCTVDQLLESGEAIDFLLADKYGEYDEKTGETVGAWPGQKWLRINLSMPRFDVSSDLDLIGGLKELGVTDVFDRNASNFDPLGASTSDPLYVSLARHAARVTVDEEGCEAAAYTVIMVEAGAAMPPDEEVDFVLDRPFLFAVTGNGLPLFTGVVNQPSG